MVSPRPPPPSPPPLSRGCWVGGSCRQAGSRRSAEPGAHSSVGCMDPGCLPASLPSSVSARSLSSSCVAPAHTVLLPASTSRPRLTPSPAAGWGPGAGSGRVSQASGHSSDPVDATCHLQGDIALPLHLAGGPSRGGRGECRQRPLPAPGLHVPSEVPGADAENQTLRAELREWAPSPECGVHTGLHKPLLPLANRAPRGLETRSE